MSQRNLILLATLGSLAVLSGAVTFQLFGYVPCKLCVWQRWPHVAAVLIGVLWFVRPWAVWPVLGALAALTTAAIGLYHSGVEWGVFAGPDNCTSNPIGGLTADQLMDQILNAPLVRCDEVPWSLFGLSIAGWNMLASFGLASLWALAATRPSR